MAPITGGCLLRASRTRPPLGWSQFAIVFAMFAALLVLLLIVFPTAAH
jgi:hypothetical protein